MYGCKQGQKMVQHTSYLQHSIIRRYKRALVVRDSTLELPKPQENTDGEDYKIISLNQIHLIYILHKKSNANGCKSAW